MAGWVEEGSNTCVATDDRQSPSREDDVNGEFVEGNEHWPMSLLGHIGE